MLECIQMRGLGILIASLATAAYGAPCAPCHANIVESFSRTGMGRSVSADAAVHTYGGVRREMAFAIGSGAAGKTYVWRLEDALFQSPLSWYRAKAGLALSPGYEQDAKPDFYRPIVEECLTCHTSGVKALVGTQNRYALPGAPAAIDCARCHGPGNTHAANPARTNIVNPARLDAVRRNSVCESCHLGGEARIPNAGKSFADFQPGMALEQVFSVYTGSSADRRVTGHAEQTAASACAKDPKLWCGTCHDPHRQPEAAERAAYYRNRCVQCHEAPEHEAARGGDCAGCHMPKARSQDGGHTAFTDHRIRLKDTPPPADGLRPWRPGMNDARGLALAHLAVSEKRASLPDLREAARRLNALLATEPDSAVLTAAGLLAMRQNKASQAVQWLERALRQEPGNARSESNLAAAYLAAGNPAKAIEHAQEALRIEPLLPEPYAILAEAEPRKAAEWKERYRKRARR